ncbi:MAG: YbaB/EbfC family nucleoid-associated protein [Dehalococcoidia bacterium]
MNKNMLRQAQQLQQRLANVQEELEQETVEASSGGGVVTVTITGKQKVQSIRIDPAAVDPQDVGMLEDLVMAAVNEAMDKAQEMANQRLSAITGGMKIPGLM